MRVLFWGTPEFAAPPLRALIGEGFDVVGVVTQPDKPVGRSRSTLEPPPVKQIALDEEHPGAPAGAPRGEEFVAQLRALAPDISVVVAYGHILPTRRHRPAAARHDQHPRVAAARAARRGADSGGDSRRASPRRASRSCAWCRRSTRARSILQARTPILDDETYGELATAPLRAGRAGADRGAGADRAGPGTGDAAGRRATRRTRRRSSGR